MTEPGAPPHPWDEALRAAALLAIDPAGLGGLHLRSMPGPVRDAWLGHLRRLLPEGLPLRRVPLHAPDARLLGGLDLAATLRAGRPVAERGLLAEADGGLLLLAMAERIEPGVAARIALALDAGEVAVERDGLALRHATRFGVVALDEGLGPEELPPAALRERLAFALSLEGMPVEVTRRPAPDAAAVAAARDLLPRVAAGPAVVEALVGTAMALGIASARAPLLALRAARANAALAGRTEVAEEDSATAARLVLAPRATVLPAEAAPPEQGPEDQAQPPPDRPEEQAGGEETQDLDPAALQEMVLAAAAAAVPPDLLAKLRLLGGAARQAVQGKAGIARASARRGRPIGSRPGALGGGARLALVETLRAAAPWQRLRRRPDRPARIEVRQDDIRLRRFRERTETTAIFVVDASGSAALHRLAEAKGAVELLLADCYVRRDQVALLAFRGTGAELLLPPTGSLVRAKRSLAGLPGGGGTPLATAIDAAAALADAVRRRGRTPILVLMTDGRANVTRAGRPGRAEAEAEAMAAAKALSAQALTALFVDTAPRPQREAERLALAMGARYLPLPRAGGAEGLSRAVRAAVPT